LSLGLSTSKTFFAITGKAFGTCWWKLVEIKGRITMQTFVFPKACSEYFEEIMKLLKSAPGKFEYLTFSDIAKFSTGIAHKLFCTCSHLLSEMKDMIKRLTIAEIKQIAATLLSTSMNELIEYIKTRNVSAEQIQGIAEHSKIKLQSAVSLELAFLSFSTTGDLFLYMCGRKNGRIVAQSFLQKVASQIGTFGGDYFAGCLLGLIFAFTGLPIPLGVTIGNIGGGMIGRVLACKFGTDWLINGKIEKIIVSAIPMSGSSSSLQITDFENIGLPRNVQ